MNPNAHPEIDDAVRRYLTAADRLLPGSVTAAALGGSVALGAYRPGASDLDLVAVLDDSSRGRPGLMRRLRLLHLSQVPRVAGRIARGLGFSATVNTSFVWASDLRRPVTRIDPVASHVGEIFEARRAFDVNPVVWAELIHGGVTVRGPDVAAWGLDPEPDLLAAWTRANLRDYWLPLADRVAGGSRPLSAGRVAWCLTGPARMLVTTMTGTVVSKADGARRAREAFPAHAPILGVALAHLAGSWAPAAPPRDQWRALTGVAMREIIAAA
ncbi:nucleotidyltransferase domain-containing protein [Tsukamurella spumae]|uniref:Polymerase nucleotidyl transferase domain-containing protein n=1 Tax=Tsukamurella spumae TaxID=44753 RepID=A0A846X7A4_9ACTN|nr:nucleotidyltransferase domain-containing protein [Tsukamurella spumae]NKY20072.1 hypothetical protein [Tsukamurella spumae]